MSPTPDQPAPKGPASDAVFSFGPFEFDPASGLLYRGEEEVFLPPRAAALLEVFLARPGLLIPKTELLDAVWKDAFVGEDSLTEALSIIRHALDDDARNPTYIETKWKRGYRFVADVRRTARGPSVPESGSETAVSAPTSPGGDAMATPDVQVIVGGRLGQYDILDDLGAGAMGVVYRARDSILERDVAIKLLPRAFLADPARVASLEREAKLLATLSHPNVASIYSLERIDGVTFPVLELVEGRTLADRLRDGAMSVRDTLEICRQVAAGVGAANEQGIVHRDLKPANIKVTPKGLAKVLDFGLATSLTVDRYRVIATDAPTESIGLTGSYRGAIVGTVAYMSPEQARGEEADARSDVWSFGCVLYEALTGRRAFERPTVSATLHAIAEEQPDWTALPAALPPLVRSLVRRCLRKAPDQRLHDIADARLEIEEALGELEAPTAAVGDAGTGRLTWRSALPWGIAVLTSALALWSFATGRLTEAPGVVHLQIGLEPGLRLSGGEAQEAGPWGFLRPSRTSVALSPDGSKLVYAADAGAGTRLYMREMSRPHGMPIQGTDGGSSPFFSPDGTWIAFYAGGALKRVPADGGEARTIIAQAPPPFGASWGDTDEIVLAAGETGGLLRVPARGGVPEVLTELDRTSGETAHRLPQLLPGGHWVLYTVIKGLFPENAEIVVESLDTRSRKTLAAGTDGRFVPTGHLVFAREGALMAVPFSLDRLETTGKAVRIVEDLMQGSGAATTRLDSGAAQFSFAGSGSLVYVPGGAYPALLRSLVWVDRHGAVEPLALPEGWYSVPRVSPDARYVAYAAGLRARRDLWVYDTVAGTSRRLTFEGLGGGATWSPDGTTLAFTADRSGGGMDLYSIAADGREAPIQLATSDQPQFVSSWSPNGTLAVVRGFTIWVLPGGGAGDSFPLLDTPREMQGPAFSPDGEWLAYSSDETGQSEVWVRAFARSTPAIRISTNGGQSPAWSRDGGELFFRSGGYMMVTRVTIGRTFTHTRPRVLFDASTYAVAWPTRGYDVGPDGRFLMVVDTEQEPQPATRIEVVLNWFEDLRQRVLEGR